MLNVIICRDVGCTSCWTSCGPGYCYLRQSLAQVSQLLLQRSIFTSTYITVERGEGLVVTLVAAYTFTTVRGITVLCATLR